MSINARDLQVEIEQLMCNKKARLAEVIATAEIAMFPEAHLFFSCEARHLIEEIQQLQGELANAHLRSSNWR